MPSISQGLATAVLMTLMAVPALADGDPLNGQKAFRKFAACHTVDSGGASRMGPNLHGIVGSVTAQADGFRYSDAMAQLGEEGHVWTPEELDRFLKDPRGTVPGNRMAFAGLKKDDERADVIAYLETLNGE
ncbi:cytochrome c family protein [uncultured Paracoccus sp.]|uniref:c-type cytochrome n=1 Tax=uncultured Paracoccus sp. TaxID=189685 RepID=UPI0025EE9CF6|nr:cytochrome c family protein [uncultured Paracoccus sp.]